MWKPVAIAAFSVFAMVSQSSVNIAAISPDSPLAANRSWLFAVAADNVTLLRQSVEEESPWRPLPPLREVKRVTGLTATEDSLYIADAASHRILKMDLKSYETSTYAELGPSITPMDLAYTNTNTLFVSDMLRPDVYAWSSE